MKLRHHRRARLRLQACANAHHKAMDAYWLRVAEEDIEDYEDDFEEPPCPTCDGEGMDPMADFLLPCPDCLGDRL